MLKQLFRCNVEYALLSGQLLMILSDKQDETQEMLQMKCKRMQQEQSDARQRFLLSIIYPFYLNYTTMPNVHPRSARHPTVIKKSTKCSKYSILVDTNCLHFHRWTGSLGAIAVIAPIDFENGLIHSSIVGSKPLSHSCG